MFVSHLSECATVMNSGDLPDDLPVLPDIFWGKAMSRVFSSSGTCKAKPRILAASSDQMSAVNPLLEDRLIAEAAIERRQQVSVIGAFLI